MKDQREDWQIVYVPEKPPVNPSQQPTVNVIASVVEPKLINTLVKHLGKIAPLENLRHVKRVRKIVIEGGQTQLSVILCIAHENDSLLDSMPYDIQELANSYKLSPFIAKVCKYAALSKEEWEEQCKLWPTSYHPPTYNIDGITGFTEEDSQSIFSFMKFAINLAKSGDKRIVNAAVIVDPSVKQVIASACDEVCTSYTPVTKMYSETPCLDQPKTFSAPPNSQIAARNGIMTSNSSSVQFDCSSASVSCLHPWKWAEQESASTSSAYWHPLRHAAIVGIESSAARDRRLFPSLEPVGAVSSEACCAVSSVFSPRKKQKTELMNVHNNEQSDAVPCNHQSVPARPYLCTGYDIFLAWEPCTMCAMALVHQRFRRIFYAFPNPSAGALGSVHRLQGEKSLNHHYAVFRVLLPEELLYGGKMTPA